MASTLVLEASGTTTTDGTEQTVATLTTNSVKTWVVDLGALANGDEVVARVYTKTLTGGTERLLWPAVPWRHAQAAPVKQSLPIPSDVSVRFTLQRTAGTDRAIPWKVLS
jgi:hypothetical protein